MALYILLIYFVIFVFKNCPTHEMTQLTHSKQLLRNLSIIRFPDEKIRACDNQDDGLRDDAFNRLPKIKEF